VSYLDILTAQLEIDEGRRPLPYDDATGKTFVKGDTLKGNLTQGVGTNLSAGFDDEEINFLRDRRINAAALLAATTYNFDDTVSDVRRAALANMAYQMKDKLSAFDTFNMYVINRQWELAADDLAKTAYAAQVPARSKRICDALRSG